MKNTKKIYKLDGRLQHYTWGGEQFLPELLQVPAIAGKPFAEYWLGAHTLIPSMVHVDENNLQALDEFIATDTDNLLGTSVATEFGRLPYLLKILDVKGMLSIQVHPDKASAAEAYERENALGIPLNDPKRNYKDDNHKPELMYALSDFWLLHGFKTPDSLSKILSQTPELNPLSEVFKAGGYAALYSRIMQMEQHEVDQMLKPLLARIIPLYESGDLPKSDASFWAARAAKTFHQEDHIDRGIFSVYVFNLVNLKPGEAIFQAAGVPHAYLEGQNVEIMSNSDNVLRGGLTTKHVDVPELLKHVKCEETIPQIITGETSTVACEERYITPAKDFELSAIKIGSPGETTIYSQTVDIFLVYRGSVSITEGEESFQREAGEAFMSVAGSNLKISAIDEAVIYRATTPMS